MKGHNVEETFLCFDLETVGLPIDVFDETQQEYLLRGTTSDEERHKKIGEFALSPMTGSIVCIGMELVKVQDGEVASSQQVAYVVDPSMSNSDERRQNTLPTGAQCFASTELAMLQQFWSALTARPVTLISFNGRNFDAPWLMLRSAVLGIRPTMNLMDGTRFNYSRHIDLLDKLTFFSGSSSGATRRFNFDFYAKAFGVTSPKSAGVDGSKVGQLYAEGRIDDIAEYCLRDVHATWELYTKWKATLG